MKNLNHVPSIGHPFCWILLLSAIFLVGATSEPELNPPVGYKKLKGDFAKAFVSKAKSYGGRIKRDDFPSFECQWAYKADKDGFQILLPTNEAERLKLFFRQAFGEPTVSKIYPHLVYKIKDAGIAIMCDLEANPIHIICLRAQALP